MLNSVTTPGFILIYYKLQKDTPTPYTHNVTSQIKIIGSYLQTFILRQEKNTKLLVYYKAEGNVKKKLMENHVQVNAFF